MLSKKFKFESVAFTGATSLLKQRSTVKSRNYNVIITINLEITMIGVMTLQWKPQWKNLVITICLEIRIEILTEPYRHYEISLHI